jgi:hypothetical protein
MTLTDAQIADWLLATLRLYGCMDWRAYQIVGLFLQALDNDAALDAKEG